MEILIGKQGNQPFVLSESSISRKHAIFRLDETTGNMTLQDHNSANGTYILAPNNTFKRISGAVVVNPHTIVRLGAKYTFRIKELLNTGVVINNTKPDNSQPVDISNLREIYDLYNKNKLEIEAQQSSIMMWRMASMSLGGVVTLGMMSMLPEDFAGDPRIGTLIKGLGTVIAIIIAWQIVRIKNKNLLRRKEHNDRFYKKKYCCPKCGYHFGAKIYDNIIAEGKCPNNNCRCKFTGK